MKNAPSNSPSQFTKTSARLKNTLIFTTAAAIIAITAWKVEKLLTPEEIASKKPPKNPYLSGEIEPNANKKSSPYQRSSPHRPDEEKQEKTDSLSTPNAEEEDFDSEFDADSIPQPDYKKFTAADADLKARDWIKKCLSQNHHLPQEPMITSEAEDTFNPDLCGSQPHLVIENFLDKTPGQVSFVIALNGNGNENSGLFHWTFFHDDSDIRYDLFCENVETVLQRFHQAEPAWFVHEFLPALQSKLSYPIELRRCELAYVYPDEKKECLQLIISKENRAVQIQNDEISDNSDFDKVIEAANLIREKMNLFFAIENLLEKYQINYFYRPDPEIEMPYCLPIYIDIWASGNQAKNAILSVHDYSAITVINTERENISISGLPELENWISEYYASE